MSTRPREALTSLFFVDKWGFSLLVGTVLLALAETGFRIGLRLFAARDEARRSQIGGVQGAVLGLLGFTFSMGRTCAQRSRAVFCRSSSPW